MGTWREGPFIWDSEDIQEKSLVMEHHSLYGISLRGTCKEGSYNEDSERHVIQGSRNGAFVFIGVPQRKPTDT
jgi:hypothetical protein